MLGEKGKRSGQKKKKRKKEPNWQEHRQFQINK